VLLGGGHVFHPVRFTPCVSYLYALLNVFLSVNATASRSQNLNAANASENNNSEPMNKTNKNILTQIFQRKSNRSTNGHVAKKWRNTMIPRLTSRSLVPAQWMPRQVDQHAPSVITTVPPKQPALQFANKLRSVMDANDNHLLVTQTRIPVPLIQKTLIRGMSNTNLEAQNVTSKQSRVNVPNAMRELLLEINAP